MPHMRLPSGQTAAIGLVLLSSLLYSLGYALSKRLIETWHFDAMQLFVLRSLLVVAGLFALHLTGLKRLSPLRLLSPPHPWIQRLAATALVLSAVLAMIGYGYLPVTTATAFSYLTPLLVTVLAAILLRERVPVQRWLAVALGFAGVLVIVHPGASAPAGAGHLIGVGAALGSAILYAIQQMLIRHSRDTMTTTDVVAQAAIVGLVLLGGAMPFVWRSVPVQAMLLVVAATAAQTGGLLTIAAAIRQGQISRLAPWQYGGMIWAMGLDLAMFGHTPGTVALSGAVMIVMGGLLSQIRLPSRLKPLEARR
ncbi:DMT family transporter [Acidisoma sp.]|uniref:DMT family transporter n=1 Tax=Acidisoma sp. TaxID=1872115 RepID=UPI003AFFAF1F